MVYRNTAPATQVGAPWRWLWVLGAGVLSLVGASPSSGGSPNSPVAPPATTQERCTQLTHADSLLPGSPSITSALYRPAGAYVIPPDGGPFRTRSVVLPAHCEVLGALNERTGVDGKHYAIRFHLRLPDTWNGRFFFEGGGGTNGNLGSALGNLMGWRTTAEKGSALDLGYAVVTQDGGHENAVKPDGQFDWDVTFGFDPQARLDYGFNSYLRVSLLSKAMIDKYYGREPVKSYYVGCSEGGREGLMIAQRFPRLFDGILSCSPGLSLPKASALAEVWDSQRLADVATKAGKYDPDGMPLINDAYSDPDLALVSQAVLDGCDSLDGLVDGVIDNWEACTTKIVRPHLERLVCPGVKQDDCLSRDQLTALYAIMGGPKDHSGKSLYSDWAWDRGIGGQSPNGFYGGWRAWKMGAFGQPTNTGINANMGVAAAAMVFTTPPTEAVSNKQRWAFIRAFDFDKNPAKIFATAGKFTQSAWSFMRADSSDLSAFQQHGGKLIVVQGVSDPIFSIKDTVRWWRAVNRRDQDKAGRFVRLFAIPGMNHCAGGPATDQYDAFSALVTWTEHGLAPDRIVAEAGANTPWPGRTRPLCPYPLQSRFVGHGDVNDAANFACSRAL